MASAFRKPIGSLSSKLVQSSAKWTANTVPKLCAPKLATRGLTLKRGLWCISSVNTKQYTHLGHNKPCSCCSIHTEGDREMETLLTKEIADEKKSSKKLATINGWDSNINGSDVKLTRKHDDELISVKFNVNDSVDADMEAMGNDNVVGEEAPQMVSKPLFNVTIKKASGKVMDFSCSFAEDDIYDESQENEEKLTDQYSIVDLTIHTGEEAADSDYVLNGATMDSMLYNLLMDMLDERGITDEFMSDLVDLCTSIEHNQYVNFLEELKTMVEK